MSYSYTYTEATTFTVTHAGTWRRKSPPTSSACSASTARPATPTSRTTRPRSIELLKAGYLGTVTYGFRRDGNWIEPTLRYTARDLAGAAGQ